MHRKASTQRQSRANTGGALTDFTHAIPRTLCGVNPLSTYKFGAILMAAKRGNLPIELSSFVGRGRQMVEVKQLLPGPGGKLEEFVSNIAHSTVPRSA